MHNVTTSVTYFVDNDTTVKNSERTFLHKIASVLENDTDTTIKINRII